jgi:exodeoxyribonuclease VII small subunit
MINKEKNPAKKETKDIDVAKGFQELEDVAAWFERGETDLDAGLEKFERAMQIADALKKRLSIAENRVKEIKKKFSTE